ncbi:hypothetical protein L596_000360 [Steinernema carpocapsae]|uniref:Uncharacterized protein n=1 Tax=Steinernema carpocapsae TaxID=34508 RepID=A0A4U8UHX4_STECR|nr:hypothetical protein L596_000360 [Steinernema carpocapsae]
MSDNVQTQGKASSKINPKKLFTTFAIESRRSVYGIVIHRCHRRCHLFLGRQGCGCLLREDDGWSVGSIDASEHRVVLEAIVKGRRRQRRLNAKGQSTVFVADFPALDFCSNGCALVFFKG